MNRRKLLARLVVLVGGIGIIILLAPFVLSLKPASHLPESYTEINITRMQPMSLKLVVLRESKKVENVSSTTYYSGDGLVVIRGNKSDYYLYWVPIWEGKIMMPYRRWGQHEGYCPKFLLGGENQGAPIIFCENSEWAEFLTKQWKWSIEGKNLGEDLPDLVPVRFRISSGEMHAFMR